VLLPLIGLIVVGLCGLGLLAITTAKVGIVAELVGVGAALVPVGVVVAAFLWVDRWEPEPAPLLWLAFAWGSCVATLTALMINNTAEAVGDMVLGNGGGDTLSAVVSAPLVEEAAKGVFVLGMLLWQFGEFHGVIDGIVYAGLCAAGFAFTENIYYFGRAFAEYGFGTVTTPGVIPAFILRGLLSPFTHPLFTMMIGIGIGIAAVSASRLVRIAAPLGGYVVAVILHALWNGAATLGGSQTFLNVYFLVMVPIFIAAAWLVNWHRRREQRIVADELPALATAGLIDANETDTLGTLRGRRARRTQVRKRSGRAAARAVGAYHAAVSELAFLRHNIRRGAAGRDAATREQKLINVVRVNRGRALRGVGVRHARS
jgi:RsiW-degrading membrane proteinase PrsW (M82 family)